MPKRKKALSPKEQSERFKSEAERLIAAGELNPTEAEAAMDRIIREAAASPGDRRAVQHRSTPEK
jgi:hypothetical protein